MELKLGNNYVAANEVYNLLIVPYGIETLHSEYRYTETLSLLIVPYGIETVFPGSHGMNQSLLIVPYGIETFQTPFSAHTERCF